MGNIEPVLASYEETLLCESSNTNNLSVNFTDTTLNHSEECPYSCTNCICDSVLAEEMKPDANIKLVKADIACQTRGKEIYETQTLHTNQDS